MKLFVITQNNLRKRAVHLDGRPQVQLCGVRSPRPAAGPGERLVLGAEGQEDRPAQHLPGLRLVFHRRVSDRTIMSHHPNPMCIRIRIFRLNRPQPDNRMFGETNGRVDEACIAVLNDHYDVRNIRQ